MCRLSCFGGEENSFLERLLERAERGRTSLCWDGGGRLLLEALVYLVRQVGPGGGWEEVG